MPRTASASRSFRPAPRPHSEALHDHGSDQADGRPRVPERFCVPGTDVLSADDSACSPPRSRRGRSHRRVCRGHEPRARDHDTVREGPPHPVRRAHRQVPGRQAPSPRCSSTSRPAAPSSTTPLWRHREPRRATARLRARQGVRGDAFKRLGVDCVQLHGAIGFTWEYDIQLYLKRSKWAFNAMESPTTTTSASPPSEVTDGLHSYQRRRSLPRRSPGLHRPAPVEGRSQRPRLPR